MLKTKYKSTKLAINYNVMVAQKHRMLYYKKLKKDYLDKCTKNFIGRTEEKCVKKY